MKEVCNAVSADRVMISFNTSNLTFRVAVAGVPETSARTPRVWRGVLVVGVPMMVAVLPDTSKERPVPANADADHRIELREAAVAAKVMGAG
jgi:hypothetical protein